MWELQSRGHPDKEKNLYSLLPGVCYQDLDENCWNCKKAKGEHLVLIVRGPIREAEISLVPWKDRNKYASKRATNARKSPQSNTAIMDLQVSILNFFLIKNLFHHLRSKMVCISPFFRTRKKTEYMFLALLAIGTTLIALMSNKC